METANSALGKFFGVVAQGQSYLNALYLFLAFPLGLFYFIFLVSGLALGVGLAILWVGLLLLVVVFAVWYALVVFERQMAIWMLREEIPPITRQNLSGMTLWQQFKAAVSNPVTWKGLAYLLAKLPLGILSFTVLVTLVSLSGALLAAPFYYQWAPPQISLGFNSVLWNPYWTVDTLGEALFVSLAGIFVTICSMHIINGLAWLSGKFARVMLGSFSTNENPPLPLEPTTADSPVLPA